MDRSEVLYGQFNLITPRENNFIKGVSIMSLTKEESAALISKFGANEADTGNVKVQIALLTERIKQLTAHVQQFPKDTGASRGLLKIIGQRRKLLKYLQNKDLELYRSLIKELGLRK